MPEPSRNNPEWNTVTAPPPPYTIVLLTFGDGSVRRGVWNGKMWWGYDERVKRACELHPMSWQLWTDAAVVITTGRTPNRDSVVRRTAT